MTRPLAAIVAVTAIAVVFVAAGAAGPRADSRDAEAFLDRAREGTRRYHNSQIAVDDGFTRVGAEFPAMGEHWVSFARILEDSFVAERPSVLIYVSTDSGRRLAGVGYTRLMTGKSAPPEFPGWDAWHEHNGEVDEESLPLRHGSHASSPAGDSAAPRLAILHAWAWSENPRGAFETDNWALPLERLGVRSGTQLPRAALQALSLADDRNDYIMLILRTGIELTAAEDSAARASVATRRMHIEPIVRAVRRNRRVNDEQSRALVQEWSAFWADLDAAVPRRRRELRRLRDRM